MIKLHTEYLTKNGEREFAVIPYQEFVALQEHIADMEDLIDLRKAKKRDAKKAGISLEEMKKELGL